MNSVKNPTRHRPDGLSAIKFSTRLSPDNLLLLLTMLVFGYCFFYVSLPFMLHKSAVAESSRTLQTSENLPQSEQDHKQQRGQGELTQARIEFASHFVTGNAPAIKHK